MKNLPMQGLSKRERQIMDIIFRLGEATAEEVIESFPEPVGDASIRKLIRVMEHKGYLVHKKRGRCYVYRPVLSHDKAGRQVIKHILKTYFYGSAPMAVSTLLDITADTLSEDDIEQISLTISKVKKEGR